MAHLARVGEVSDHTGRASTLLAATVGYPGSSVAFAQLLSGMERAGLIEREIRGKRTYRIIPGPAAPPDAPPDAVSQHGPWTRRCRRQFRSPPRLTRRFRNPPRRLRRPMWTGR